jgi:predicted P-loop ATPase
MARTQKAMTLDASMSCDWREVLRSDGRGFIQDEDNIVRALEADPALKGLLSFNEFAGEIILRGHLPSSAVGTGEFTPRRWTDADAISLQTHLQSTLMPRLGRDKVHGAVLLHASRRAFHPVRAYLNALTWDNQARVAHLLVDYFNALTQPEAYLISVARAFMIAAVARAMDPACQVDSAIVLEGGQGIGKTTALRILASDEYFSDSLPHDLASKDARDHLRGKWIIELPELTQFKKSEIETVKAFLSRRVEIYRPSYGRNEVSFPRQCVFAGTTNETEYLVDTTGNRRFWPVTCGDIDLHGLALDRDQLWAEAVALYKAGTPWHLTGEAAEAAANQAKDRVTTDPWLPMVSNILNSFALTANEMAPGEILERLDINPEQRHAKAAVRVGTILRDLGWQRGRRDRTRGQLYARPQSVTL